MKKIGLVGGLGWRSAVEYYAGICELAEARQKKSGAGAAGLPEISIESLDLATAVGLLGSDDNEASWERFDAYHRQALLRLAAAGADFALIASNTPHHRLAAIARGIAIPVLDLFQLSAQAAAQAAVTEVVVLGTPATMSSERFRAEFARRNIRVIVPLPEIKAQIASLIARLQCGADAEAGDELDRVARRCLRSCRSAAPAVCLACTELPLAFPESKLEGCFVRNGIRYIGTPAVHIRAAVEMCFSA